ncbi:unnamed protein product [Lactuca saligna]|uniref:Uncharacterized protein n=1 Tax=Lactuca saligna TaxID=75948 RepID=A0AA35VI83_LACSI|nr:unnamed protein product [Lactuca saligna]
MMPSVIKVKALFQPPHGIEDPPMAPTQSTHGDLPVDPPPPRTTTIVNKFEKEPEGSRARITIKQGKRTVTASKSEGLLFMKKSNENRKAKDPVLTITDLKKRKFGDAYGDRSRIRMWTFDPESNTWVVKRNSSVSEYYKSVHDFNSWTKVDLAELSRAPFQKIRKLWILNQAYDDETATAAIKFKDREQVLRLISAKDILRFRERDIRTLSHHQIIVRKDVMQAAAKEYIGMVVTIINGRLWMGSMGKSDLKLFEKLTS